MMRNVRATLGAAVMLLILADNAAAQDEMAGMAQEMMRWHPTAFFMIEKLEFAPDAADRPLALDGIAWWGGARSRLWFRGEGERPTSGEGGEAEAELLYGRLISPFFDALVGIRFEGRWGEDDSATRGFLSLGLEGMAPLWWELAPTLFVSQDGDVSARLDASYALLFTQRLILEPEVELNAALQEVPEFGVGSGLNDIALSARMRYELHRKFAPYVGVSWLRRTGQTASLARVEGEPVSDVSLVGGLRLWY